MEARDGEPDSGTEVRAASSESAVTWLIGSMCLAGLAAIALVADLTITTNRYERATTAEAQYVALTSSLLRSVGHAEDAVQQVLLTGDPAWLEGYETAASAALADARELPQQAPNLPAVRSTVQRARSGVEARINDLDVAVAMLRQGRPGVAQALFEEPPAASPSADVRNSVASAEAAARRDAQAQRRSARARATVAQGILFLDVMLLAVLIGVAMRVTYRRRLTEQQARAEAEQARRESRTDELTGLPNRRMFFDLATKAAARARRHDSNWALIFMDLDHFKQLNGSFGHRAGDEVLIAVGQRLRSTLRREDTLARLGGDEFVAVVEGFAHPCEVDDLVERLREACCSPVSTSDGWAVPCFSAGVLALTGTGHVLTPDGPGPHELADLTGQQAPEEERLELLLSLSDRAMYQAKDVGGGVHRWFDPSRTAHRAAALVASLRGELDTDPDAIRPAYQVLVDLTSEEVVAVEALVRWPTSPSFPPATAEEIIAAAELGGLLPRLGTVVRRHAIGEIQAWNAERVLAGVPPLQLWVNASVLELEQEPFVPTLLDQTRRAGLPNDLLVVEITEAERADLAPHAPMNALREAGVRMALDDLGAGATTVRSLVLPLADIYKVDRALVNALTGPGPEADVVRAISGVAGASGVLVVAEGIEDRAKALAARDAGCRLGQGSLFGKPMLPSPKLLQALDVRFDAGGGGRGGPGCGGDIPDQARIQP